MEAVGEQERGRLGHYYCFAQALPSHGETGEGEAGTDTIDREREEARRYGRGTNPQGDQDCAFGFGAEWDETLSFSLCKIGQLLWLHITIFMMDSLGIVGNVLGIHPNLL